MLDYSHSDGRAVIGGYVYRGKEFMHDLGGKYIFGDNVFRTVWALDETTTPFKKTLLCVLPKGTGPNAGTDYTGLSSFGTDANGELYLCQMSSIGGHIYKLQRGGPPPPTKVLPKLLSQTGVFTDLEKFSPAEALIPYTVNSPLWSDGAVKSRWLVVPTNSVIGFAATGEWTFPPGTVFVKHFDLPVDETNPKYSPPLSKRACSFATQTAPFMARAINGARITSTPSWFPSARMRTSKSKPRRARARKNGFIPDARIASPVTRRSPAASSA